MPREVNGASTATSADAPNSYFGTVNGGRGDGDTWAGQDHGRHHQDAGHRAELLVPDHHSTSGGTAQASKTAFGYDLDGSGSIGTGEFGEWSVNLAAGTITFANPAVPRLRPTA